MSLAYLASAGDRELRQFETASVEVAACPRASRVGWRSSWLRGVVATATGFRRAFRAVSDDDYARVVIAEALAHAPRSTRAARAGCPLPFG